MILFYNFTWSITYRLRYLKFWFLGSQIFFELHVHWEIKDFSWIFYSKAWLLFLTYFFLVSKCRQMARILFMARLNRLLLGFWYETVAIPIPISKRSMNNFCTNWTNWTSCFIVWILTLTGAYSYDLLTHTFAAFSPWRSSAGRKSLQRTI